MNHIFSKENRSLISGRLKYRTGMFLGIAAVLFCFVIYDVFAGEAAWWMPLLGLVAGLVIGIIFGRLARVRWHETEEKIVTQNDAMGFVLIGAYVLLAMARNYLLHDLLTGAALIVVSLALGSGVLFGRFLGMHFVIMRTLRAGRPQS